MMNVQSWKKQKTQKYVESGIKTNACLLAAESVSFKIDHPILKRILFQYFQSKFTAMNFLGHTTNWSDYDMQ